MNKTAIEKRASSVLDRARVLLAELRPVAPVSKAGGHVHKVEPGAATTELGGEHVHTFVLPVSIRFQPEGGGTVEIPAGTSLKTEMGGPHAHRAKDGEVVEEMSAHRHVIPVQGGYELFTETDGEHTHEAGGDHDHHLRLGDKMISSKEAKRLDPAVCSIAQAGSIEEISADVLGSPDTPPVIVWQAEPPSGALPALKLPDPQFIIDRLLDGKPAGLLSIRRRARRVGQPQLLVNEVGPLGLEKAFVWAVVAHGEPVQIESVAALSLEQQQGLDRFTKLEFDDDTDLFHLPLELAVVFDPPLELSKPPGGRRFGSTVDLEKDVVRSRQISIEEMLRDMARRQVHDFVNDPSTNTLRRATTGHLLEIDRQLHMLFERAFASKDVTREEGVTRDDTISAHEFVMRELARRRVETVETDVLATETRALLQLQEGPEIAIVVGKRIITASELRELAGKGLGRGPGGQGFGPGGECICPSCGHTELHETGVACLTKACPVCGTALVHKQESTTIQTLIFSKEVFETADEAKQWAKDHDFKFGSVDETETSFRLRQIDPEQFQEGTFRTIDITEGIKAVVGILKTAAQKQAPRDDMSREQLIAAREARSREFGIEVLEAGSALTFPAGMPTTLQEYGDPVNLKYPFETPERARNARVRFKQNADAYQQQRSKAVVHERIVRAELRHGVTPSFDPDDELDALLPSELKERLQQAAKVEKATGHDVRILKQQQDEEERYVFGVVLVPDEVDAQGDTYDAPTIRRAAHSFMENGQRNKIMHDGRPVQGVTVLETYLAKQMETHNRETFPAGTWFLAVRVGNDDIWKAIKNGSFTGFSMGGTAVREALS